MKGIGSQVVLPASGLVVQSRRLVQRWLASGLLALRAYAPLYLMVLLYALLAQLHSGMVISSVVRLAGSTEFTLALLLLALLTLAAAYFMVRYIFIEKPASPLQQLAKDFRTKLKVGQRVLNLIALYPFHYLFSAAFLSVKGTIGIDAPFAWDRFFTHLDRQLHGGLLPWEWLFPLLSSGPATVAINFVYHMWFFFMFAVLMWLLLTSRTEELHIRYLVAFLLTWSIGGSLLAWIFASAGPVYNGNIGLSPNPYEPLMNHLHELSKTYPVWALSVQDLLWQEHLAGTNTLGGISAFPSMHNAQATLLALLAWRMHRLAGIFMTIFAVFIAIGSVWLGWHYAVDAYAGILIAIICWWVAGWMAPRIMRRPAMRAYLALQEGMHGDRGK